MGFIQANAEAAVRDMLHAFSLSCGLDTIGTVTAVWRRIRYHVLVTKF